MEDAVGLPATGAVSAGEHHHVGPRSRRQGHLEQAPPAVSQGGGAPGHHAGEVEPLEEGHGLVDRRLVAGHRPPPPAGPIRPLGDGEQHGLQRGEIGEQLVDLEGPGQAQPGARVGRGR